MGWDGMGWDGYWVLCDSGGCSSLSWGCGVRVEMRGMLSGVGMGGTGGDWWVHVGKAKEGGREDAFFCDGGVWGGWSRCDGVAVGR